MSDQITNILAGLLLGVSLTLVYTAIDVEDELAMAELSRELITQCEEFIPRNQSCKLIAVIAEEK